MRLLARVREASPYPVGDSLRSAHPLVRAAKNGLANTSPDERELVSPRSVDAGDVLCILVGKNSVPCAPRSIDALLKAIERVGGRIEFDGDRWRRRTVVSFAGEKASTIRLRERYNQRPNDEPRPKTSIQRWAFS